MAINLFTLVDGLKNSKAGTSKSSLINTDLERLTVVKLSDNQFHVSHYLMDNQRNIAGRIVSKEQLIASFIYESK